jgi:hypothetical protein
MGHVKLEGAVDLHCHFGPDFLLAGRTPNHSVTALQAAQEAADAGMAALVLKAHDFPTPALAYSINEAVPGVQTCGSITLDHQVGGVNPWAVEHALRLGAKVVWLPTVSSHQDYLNGIGPRLGYPGTGFKVVDEDGELLPAARDILELIVAHDAIIATGHTTAAEHFAVAKAFGRRGRVVVTHACEVLAGPHLDHQQCIELAELGAYVELTAQLCVKFMHAKPKPVGEVAQLIHAIGPEQVVLSTDYGHTNDLPHPVQGLRDYLDGLWEAGVPEADLRRMACDNGARLLGMIG